ncbi:MAG: 2-amino-4-hydroxy-6-hydroxymethyldihydropteridine diphosphokinase [Verrucomicrobiaceae bacterium]|nr:2-amino-4-hydroxy-6-hydroxymethyldihydropteridine diphosphokinase [Verrucomicrobiaceae bacterium]
MSLDSVTESVEPSESLGIGIGFGSNLGNRLANLSKAKKELLKICDSPENALFSPVYETSPLDCPPHSRAFYNAVGHLNFNCPAESILEHCHRIERSMGRARENDHEKNSPRTIDLDILYAGDRISEDAKLTIPHPRLRARLFVIAPLARILPALCLPGDNRTINDYYKELTLNNPELPVVTQQW